MGGRVHPGRIQRLLAVAIVAGNEYFENPNSGKKSSGAAPWAAPR